MDKFNYNATAVQNLKLTDTAILERLVDGVSAREHHLGKERAKVDKRMSLSEAVATFVDDGDILSDAGFSYVRTSQQSYFEILRQHKKDLQVIGSPNTNHSYMINYGTAAFSHNSYLGAEMRGYDRNYSRQLKNEKVTILSEWSHGSMAQGFKAAQLGVPGIFSKQLLGSDILAHNPYVHLMDHPLTGEPVVFIPALHPDIVFIHVHAADKYGNACIYGPVINDAALAAACRKVVITAEEIVPEDEFRSGRMANIPYLYVDAVVELPFGAVPGNMPGHYYWSRQWWEKVFRLATRDDVEAKKFFDHWIMDSPDQYAFVDKLGGARWIAEARRQTRAAEHTNEDIDLSYEEYTYGNDPGRYY